MAQGANTTNRALILQAAPALDKFKYEVANELGIDTTKIQSGYWGELPARDCGAVGGHMVRRMIAAAEQALIDQVTSGVQAGFTQALQANQARVPNPATGLGAAAAGHAGGANFQTL